MKKVVKNTEHFPTRIYLWIKEQKIMVHELLNGFVLTIISISIFELGYIACLKHTAEELLKRQEKMAQNEQKGPQNENNGTTRTEEKEERN